jgi:hypothetical protein
MARLSLQSSVFSAALGIVASLVTPVASAQCAVAGVTSVRGLRVGSVGPLDLEQSMVTTFVGERAVVEGRSPLAFRGVAAPSEVALYLREGVLLSALVGVAIGVRVEVERGERDAVIATLRGDNGLVVRSIRVACALLDTSRARDPRPAAPRPALAVDRRWRTDATAREEWRCTSGLPGVGVCTAIRGRCQPVGDGSVCGYHPQRRSLVLRARPDVRSAGVTIEATRDVSFADDSGNREWVRVFSRGSLEREDLVVHGWVRRADVRWSQEVPPSYSTRIGTIGRIGEVLPAGARSGFAALAAGTAVSSEAGIEWARTVAPLCARAVQRAPFGHVRLALAPVVSRHSGAWVAPTSARWVDRCP